MKRFIHFVVWIFFLLFTTFEVVHAVNEWTRIDKGISPIRDEFTVNPGSTIKRTVKFYNNSTTATLVYITSEDCIQGEDYGTPKCRSYAGTGWADVDNASTWIKIDWADRFTVPAKWEKDVAYTVTAPVGATPGGHYGAIFLNNPGQSTSGNSVDMVRRIGMLYLIDVPGNIIVETTLGKILVDIPTFNSAPDIWNRLVKNISDASAWNDLSQELNPFWEKPVLGKTDLQVTLNIPVQNSGNIHIKPTGKIYIYDGEEMLKKIGKESIVNENGVYIWEKVVDYLPINDEQGNVLPNSERVFHVDWIWFASQEIGPDGNSIISFESPSDYFARTSEDNAQFIYPWEKLSIRNATKQLTAKVEFTYKNPKTWVDEVSTLELPITISYNYITKTLNWGVIIIVILLILLAWMIIRRRNSDIEELEDEVDDLDDEIAVLEKAQKALLGKKATAKKVVTTTKKEVALKKVSKPVAKTVTKKPATTKATTSKTSPAAPKKAPANTSTKTGTKKVPAKKPVAPKKTTPAVKSTTTKKAPPKAE